MHVVVFSKPWASISHIVKKPSFAYIVRHFLYTPDKLRPEHKYIHFRQLYTVLDLFRGITEIKRHYKGSRLQDPEVDRKPLQTVHKQDRYLVASLNPSLQQQVRKSIRLLIKYIPCDLTAVIRSAHRLDQLKLLPRNFPRLGHPWIDLYQAHVFSVQPTILLQNICNRHFCKSPSSL